MRAVEADQFKAIRDRVATGDAYGPPAVILALSVLTDVTNVRHSVVQQYEQDRDGVTTTTWDVVWLTDTALIRCKATKGRAGWDLSTPSELSGDRPDSLEAWVRPLTDVVRVDLTEFRGRRSPIEHKRHETACSGVLRLSGGDEVSLPPEPSARYDADDVQAAVMYVCRKIGSVGRR